MSTDPNTPRRNDRVCLLLLALAVIPFIVGAWST